MSSLNKPKIYARIHVGAELSSQILLWLWSFDLCTGTIPEELGKLTALERLDLGSNNLTGERDVGR